MTHDYNDEFLPASQTVAPTVAVTTNGDTTARHLYDPNGNRLTFENPQSGDTASATYDAQDRMLRYKDTAYSYSAAGDLQAKTEGASTTTYAYDPLGNCNHGTVARRA